MGQAMPMAGKGAQGPASAGARRSNHLRPHLGGLDFAVHFWRARWLMLAVFLPVAAIGIMAAWAMPERYMATSRLLVSPAQDGSGRGDDAAGFGMEALVRSEIEFLRSPLVARQALRRVTPARAYPELAAACEPEACERLGIAAVSGNMTATAAPEAPVIVVRFVHQDPEVSSELLNALVSAYLVYRKDLFTERRADALQDQRVQLEAERAAADEAIRDYLITNGLTDLTVERDTARLLYQGASRALQETQSRRRLAEVQLGSYREQIAEIDPQQELYSEDSSAQALLALNLERGEWRCGLAQRRYVELYFWGGHDQFAPVPH